MKSLEGKCALITGGARGIGRGIAEVFVEKGASVMLADLDEESAKQTADELGDRAFAVGCDVVQGAQVEAAIRATQVQLGKVDIIVNNAGIELASMLIDMDESTFDRSVAVNLRGVFNGIRYGAPAIRDAGGGSIINIASIAAFGAGPTLGAYSTTKAGVVKLTQTAAVELRSLGIRVNAICPGWIMTEMADQLRELVQEMAGMSLEEYVTLKQGRPGEPRDIGNVAAHLASAEASLVSGIAYVVDNGYSLSA